MVAVASAIASSFACHRLEASASPLAKGNKKCSHTTPTWPWAMADCASGKAHEVFEVVLVRAPGLRVHDVC